MVFVVKGHFHSISKAAMSELCQVTNSLLNKVKKGIGNFFKSPIPFLTKLRRELVT